jgi:enoyl-CoA hydratase/carnithine racemase
VLGGILVALMSVRSTEPRQHLVGMLQRAPMMVLGAVLGIAVGHGHLLALVAVRLVATGVVLVQQKRTPPYRPQRTGKVERLGRRSAS